MIEQISVLREQIRKVFGLVARYRPVPVCLILLQISLAGFTQTSDRKHKKENIQIIAHRGGMTERPENTISSYKRAVEQGADMLEIDVRTSSDGILFILHDTRLDRTTNGHGTAMAFTMEALSQLDAGSWFDPAYANERIPSFREALLWAKSAKAVLLLDLKETGQVYVERVVDDIKKYAKPSNVVIGVRTVEEARLFRKLLPKAKQLGFIPNAKSIESFADAGVDVIRLWLRWLDKDPLLAQRVRATGVGLMVNGAKGKLEEAKKLLSFSPDWILVDDPAQLKKSLQELGYYGK